MSGEAIQKAAQATLALKKHLEEVEKLVDSLESERDQQISTIVGNKLNVLEDRIRKLYSSPTVEASPQLKPHVEVLVSRLEESKEKFAQLSSQKESVPAEEAPTAASPSPAESSPSPAPVESSSSPAPVESSSSPVASLSSPRLKTPVVQSDSSLGDEVDEVKVDTFDAPPKQKRASLEPPPVMPTSSEAAAPKSKSHIVRRPNPSQAPPIRDQMLATAAFEIPAPLSRSSRSSSRSSRSSQESKTPSRRSSERLSDAPLLEDDLVMTPPKDDSEVDWKAEFEAMRSKFESSKSLILKLQEKVRRVEAVNANLQKKVTKNKGKIDKFRKAHEYYEERIPVLNGRIVELDRLVKPETEVYASNDKVWVLPPGAASTSPPSWYDATVVSQAGADAFVVRLVNAPTKDEIVKMVNMRHCYTPSDDVVRPPLFESEDDTSEMEPIAPVPVPVAKEATASSSPPTRGTGMDALLDSARQNVKSLFNATKKGKAQEKIRSIFSTPTRASGAPRGEEQLEEIPEDAVVLADVQKIHVSDLWAALLDPQSSESLYEVFFSTYEYHMTWEQIFATLTSLYNESAGSEPVDIQRRAHVLKLLMLWVSYSPDVVRAKASEPDHIKSFSFADKEALESSQEVDQLNGKCIVGSYSAPKVRSASPMPLPRGGSSQRLPGRSAVSSNSLAVDTASLGPKSSSKSMLARSPRSRRGETITPASELSPSTSPRARFASISPRVNPSNSFSAAPVPEEGTETDMSSFSEDDDAEDGDEGDSKTRRKGEKLFKSIGSIYSSLNMDSQSLRRAFRNANDMESEMEEASAAAAASSNGDQLGFLDALTEWVDSRNIFADESCPEVETFKLEFNLWRKGPSRRKSRSIMAKKLVRQDGLKKKGGLADMNQFKEVKASSITSFTPVAVAKQLFLEEFELYSSIKSSEFRRLRFMDAKTGHSFQYMVHRFNTWCSWIATEVLNRPTSLERASVVEFFIEVGAECNRAHNFNTAYAIIGGLNQPSVARLKHTWHHVSKKAMRTYNKVLAFWSTSNNMGVYRAELRRIKPPAVPYLGLIGKDLFQTEEGSPTVLSAKTDEDWVLNFHKLRALAHQFHVVRSLQQPSDAPDWEPNMEVATCISAVSPFTDDEAYELSLKHEPRGITAAELYNLEHPNLVVTAGEEKKEGAGDAAAADGGDDGNEEKPLNLRADMSWFESGTAALDDFANNGDAADHLEVLGCVALTMLKSPEFAAAEGKKTTFPVSGAVKWIVKELKLLASAKKFDMEKAEHAKHVALRILEGMRNAGLIIPAKKWQGRLQATLKAAAGFQGLSFKADDSSVWSIETEELEKLGAKL